MEQTKLDRAVLLDRLRKWAEVRDLETAHIEADNLLLEYIDDLEISKTYHAIEKWYA